MDKNPGKRLRLVRDKLGLTTYEMAIKLEMPQSTYSKAENGYCGIHIDFLTRLYLVFKVEPKFICVGIGDKFEKAESKQTLIHDLSIIKANYKALEAKVNFLESRYLGGK